MTERGKYQVFVSHSSKNQDEAEAVRTALEGAGVPCWLSYRDIPSGGDWAKNIAGALSECPLVLLVYSREANASPHVQREISMATRLRREILPVRVGLRTSAR